MGNLKEALAVHLNYPLESFSLCITFKSEKLVLGNRGKWKSPQADWTLIQNKVNWILLSPHVLVPLYRSTFQYVWCEKGTNKFWEVLQRNIKILLSCFIKFNFLDFCKLQRSLESLLYKSKLGICSRYYKYNYLLDTLKNLKCEKPYFFKRKYLKVSTFSLLKINEKYTGK